MKIRNLIIFCTAIYIHLAYGPSVAATGVEGTDVENGGNATTEVVASDNTTTTTTVEVTTDENNNDNVGNSTTIEATQTEIATTVYSPCTCDSNNDCPCLQGLIKSIDQTSRLATYTLSGPGTHATIASDVLHFNSSICYIIINGVRYDQTRDDTSFILNDQTVPVQIRTGIQEQSCNFTLSYRVYNITELKNITGNISSGSYLPNTATLYIVNLTESAAMSANISLTSLQLTTPPGLVDTSVHDTLEDYLIIGSEGRVLVEEEVMFYGVQENTPHHIQVNSPVFHVYFYSGDYIKTTSGFNINYRGFNKTIPTTTTTTTESPRTDEIIDMATWAAINGLDKNDESAFQEVIFELAKDYIADNNNIQFSGNISSSDVVVNEVLGCNEFLCLDVCVAYNFSISTVDDQNNYIFNKSTLQDMLFRDISNTNGIIKEHFNNNCEICDEDAKLSWSQVRGVALGMLVACVILVIIVMSISRYNRVKRYKKTAILLNKRRASVASSTSDFAFPWDKDIQSYDINIDVSTFGHLEEIQKNNISYQSIDGVDQGYTNYCASNDDDNVVFTQATLSARPTSATELAFFHPLGKKEEETSGRINDPLPEQSTSFSNPALGVPSDDEDEVVTLRRPYAYRSVTPKEGNPH